MFAVLYNTSARVSEVAILKVDDAELNRAGSVRLAEGINSKIMAIKRRVGGYRNRENFKTAIYFYCGGLNLYPQ